MSLITWLVSLLHHPPPPPDPAKIALSTRQDDIADHLAAMRGSTRDEVLRQAYRRVDRVIGHEDR